jgi:hypothetical protein
MLQYRKLALPTAQLGVVVTQFWQNQILISTRIQLIEERRSFIVFLNTRDDAFNRPRFLLIYSALEITSLGDILSLQLKQHNSDYNQPINHTVTICNTKCVMLRGAEHAFPGLCTMRTWWTRTTRISYITVYFLYTHYTVWKIVFLPVHVSVTVRYKRSVPSKWKGGLKISIRISHPSARPSRSIYTTLHC